MHPMKLINEHTGAAICCYCSTTNIHFAATAPMPSTNVKIVPATSDLIIVNLLAGSLASQKQVSLLPIQKMEEAGK
jgi:hypothetical protein